MTDHSFLYEIWKGEREEKMGINLDRHTLLGVQFFFLGSTDFAIYLYELKLGLNPPLQVSSGQLRE